MLFGIGLDGQWILYFESVPFIIFSPRIRKNKYPKILSISSFSTCERDVCANHSSSEQRSDLAPIAPKIFKAHNLGRDFASSFTPKTTTDHDAETNSSARFGGGVAYLEDYDDEEITDQSPWSTKHNSNIRRKHAKVAKPNRASYNFQLGLINTAAISRHMYNKNVPARESRETLQHDD